MTTPVAIPTVSLDSGKKKTVRMGPVRDQLEAFGVAILAAVLLKWFCLEAYQIPTSSMQPTLMGSNEAGVYDRILVDKIAPLWREPQRWDVTVFGYPLQKNQNYVKRLVGLPGDRLAIRGGNLYLVEDKDGRRDYRILRKPNTVQAGMWKEVYPLRREVRAEKEALGSTLVASPTRSWKESGDSFTGTMAPGDLLRLSFRDDTDGGLIDRVWDGYPVEVARAIRDKTAMQVPHEIVPDVRLGATVTPTQAVAELSLEIEVLRPKLDKLTYALVCRNGKAQMLVRGKEGTQLGSSPEFDFPLPVGAGTHVSFAHCDDELIVERDGRELQRFDSAAWPCRDGCEVSRELSSAPDKRLDHRVLAQFALKGQGGQVTLTGVRIERDLHYTRSSNPERRAETPDVIEVPEGHYFMMGDNTLQSVDSRDWTAVTVGVLPDGTVVPPDTQGARRVTGNKRPVPPTEKPDRDETPIAIPSRNAIVMIDEYGEILRLKAKAGADWGRRVSFAAPDTTAGEWAAAEQAYPFVRREDIRGRALLVFYPFRPIAWLFGNAWPGRFGFIR